MSKQPSHAAAPNNKPNFPWSKLEPPGLVRLALEGRAPWEHIAYFASLPFLKRMPKGDGHAVLVIPGFIAGDNSTYLLRNFLNDQGYDAHGWQQGRNLGPRPGVLEASLEQLKQLHGTHGRKVSLIGWSLGGIYARELAKMEPSLVRCVITLGSPFAGTGDSSNAWGLYKFFNRDHEEIQGRYEALATPPQVPTTAIFSRTDGVVAWQSSCHSEAQLAQQATLENIEVEASHVGMGAHPLALMAIADRLAQAEGQWKPFERDGWRQLAFRDPTRANYLF